MKLKNSKKLTMVCDCDEVLVNITPLWVSKIYEKKDIFEKYLNLDPKLNNVNEVLMRNEYYLSEWLKRKNISNEDYDKVIKMILDLYTNDKNFYDKCEPTTLCKSLVQYDLANGIDKLIVLTKCCDENLDSKIRFINDNLAEIKNLEIRKVGLHEKKSSYLDDLDHVDAIFEDEINNVIDMALNSKAVMKSETDIYMPYMGYNILSEEQEKVLEENNNKIMKYFGK